MLGSARGWATLSPPPSLANAVLRRASDGGSEGMAGRSHKSILQHSAHGTIVCWCRREWGDPNRFVVAPSHNKWKKNSFATASVRDYPNDRRRAPTYAVALGRPH